MKLSIIVCGLLAVADAAWLFKGPQVKQYIEKRTVAAPKQVSRLEKCAGNCVGTAIEKTRCASTNSRCICKQSKNFLSNVDSCASSACDAQEHKAATVYAEEYCATVNLHTRDLESRNDDQQNGKDDKHHEKQKEGWNPDPHHFSWPNPWSEPWSEPWTQPWPKPTQPSQPTWTYPHQPTWTSTWRPTTTPTGYPTHTTPTKTHHTTQTVW